MSGAPHRLLVVDDNEDNRDLLGRMLARKGHLVTLAEDGPSALAHLEAEAFDLVLLDVMMPGMSGLEVLTRLRASHPKAELPVLMTTALTDSADVVAALRAGANDYITKPIDFAVAFARVDGLLELRDQVQATREPASAVVGLDGSVAPGTVLDGRYRVESVLGEGGFAVVFAATQLSTGQVVALKLLRAHRLASGGDGALERRRFEREMSLIGRLRHPNIVRLIDSGQVQVVGGGSAPPPARRDIPPTRPTLEPDPDRVSPGLVRIPYLVMEHLDGQPLSALLAARAPLAVAEAVDLTLPVVSAVAAAHRAGVVHRDLKPPNIMIVQSAAGALEPKVLDFGIAKLRDEGEPSITHDAGLVGTPEYMSPEQAKGLEAGAGADQYALGVILYEALTGSRPFAAPSVYELLHRIATGDCLPAGALRPGLPPGLEAVIARAMSVDPAARFVSLEALCAALSPHASPAVAARWGAAPAAERETPAAPAPAATPEAPALAAAGRPSAEPTLSFELPPPPASPRRPVRRAVPAALAVGVVGVAVLWFASARESTAPPLADTHVVSALPGPGVPESARIRLSIDVRPSDAAIYLDGELMGHGSLDTSLTKGDEPYTLRLVAPGYAPDERQLDASLGPAVIELLPL